MNARLYLTSKRNNLNLLYILLFFAESFLKNYSKYRLALYKMCTHTYWIIAITIVILLNVICMALQYYKMPQVSILYSYHITTTTTKIKPETFALIF